MDSTIIDINIEGKKVIVLSILTMLVLMALAYVYAEERIVFADTGMALFKMLNEQTFFIANYRFVSLISECLTLIGIKNNLPLENIIQLYSLNYYLIDIIVLILLFYVKDYKNVLVLLMTLTLFNNLNFFYPFVEYHKTFTCCILLLSLLQNCINKHTHLYYAAISLLSVIIIFSHPLACISLLFTILFYFITSRKNKYANLLYGLSVLFVSITKLVFFPTSYEQSRMGLSWQQVMIWKDNILISGFGKSLVHHDYILLILFLIVVISLILRKQKDILALVITFFFGYLLLIMVFYKQHPYNYYTEALLKPLVFYISVVFVHSCKVRFKLLIITITVAVSLLNIYHHRKIFTAHIDRYEKIIHIMKQHNMNKALLNGWVYEYHDFDDRWASSYESLIVNKLLYPHDSSRTFFISYCITCDRSKNENFKGHFIDNEEVVTARYFNVPAGEYEVIDSLYH